jgi:hypothetical protein
MKTINTQGITHLEELEGTAKWLWGTDYIHGDLYEAEELFYSNHKIKANTLLFVSYPEGKVIQPIKAQDGQYFGKPIYYDNHIIILLVDFNVKMIQLEQYDEITMEVTNIVSIPLSEVKDCYNLMPNTKPLMLTRRGSENLFEIIYPTKIQFSIGNNESFYFRNGDKLYFSAWFEDEEYREEVIVRDVHTGEVMENISGAITLMPDGQVWLLR